SLRLLVQLADDKAQVIDAAVGGFRSCAGFEGCCIASTHHTGKHAYFEKRDELLLRVDLMSRRRGGLGPPCGTQHAIAVERQQAGEEAGPRRLRRGLEREHL